MIQRSDRKLCACGTSSRTFTDVVFAVLVSRMFKSGYLVISLANGRPVAAIPAITQELTATHYNAHCLRRCLWWATFCMKHRWLHGGNVFSCEPVLHVPQTTGPSPGALPLSALIQVTVKPGNHLASSGSPLLSPPPHPPPPIIAKLLQKRLLLGLLEPSNTHSPLYISKDGVQLLSLSAHCFFSFNMREKES